MSDEFTLPRNARQGLVDAIMEALPPAYIGASTREKWECVVDDHFRSKVPTADDMDAN